MMIREQIEAAERIVRHNLQAEYEAHDAVVKRTDELKEIVHISLAALKDHSPALAGVLKDKAKKIFGETP